MNEKWRFINDCTTENMHFGTIIRSPISKGIIDTIQLPSNIPDDFTFCRLKDIPGDKYIKVFDQQIPLLADKEVEYEGQPLLLLSSASADKLKSESKKIHINYQQEPALPSISRYEQGQITGTKTVSRGRINSAFVKAFQIIESTYHFFYQGQISNDPEGAYAEYLDGIFSIYATTNWPAHIRESIAAVFNIPVENVIVHPLVFPPSYESKLWRPTLYSIFAALLAWKAKNPVRIMMYPHHSDNSANSVNSSLVHVKSAMGRTGSLDALEVSIDYDCGAAAVLPDEILRRSIYPVYFNYPCKNMKITANLIKTNTVPATPTPSLGTAHIITALESELNRIAELANRSPGDWRIESSKQNNHVLPDHTKLIDKIMEASDFQRKYSGYEMMKKRRKGFPTEYTPVRGIAMATGFQGSGFSGPLEGILNPCITVRLDSENNVTIITSAPGRTTSIERTWKEMVGNLLDLPAASVVIQHTGLEHGIDSGPSVLSRNIAILTPLIQKCCEAIQKKRFRSPLPIEIKRSVRIPKSDKWDESSLTGNLFQSSTYGAAVVELEFDSVTLEIDIRGIWLYVYCGSVVNRELAIQTIESGILHALRWAAAEDIWIRYPKGFESETKNIPWVSEAGIHIEIFDESKKFQPGGVEMLPLSIVPPAFLSALSQAANIYFDSIPQYPETIQRMIEEMQV